MDQLKYKCGADIHFFRCITGRDPDWEEKLKNSGKEGIGHPDETPPSKPAANDKDTKQSPTKTLNASKHIDSKPQQEIEESEDSGWTPHQKLNRAVYVILIGIVIAVFNAEYGGLVTTFFRHYFPREAAALGFPPLR